MSYKELYQQEPAIGAEPEHPLRTKVPASLHVQVEGDTVPQRNYKTIQNLAAIEIAELKDALAYAEYQLAKNIKEKETLAKEQTSHTFQIKEVEDRLRGAEQDKEHLQRDISRMNEKFSLLEGQQEQVSLNA